MRERERKREGRWTAEQIRDQAKQVTPPKLAALAERGRVVTRERSEKNEKERERIKENRRKGEREREKWKVVALDDGWDT